MPNPDSGEGSKAVQFQLPQQSGIVTTPFRLFLSGSAVRRTFAVDKRVLEGWEDGLTIGRAHQKDLHSEAFEQELRQYISRDHFRIECGRDGSYGLSALTDNPLWRKRGAD